MQNPLRELELNLTRRQRFGRGALGLGAAALAQLLGGDLLADDAAAKQGLHHPAKAKRVIYLFMSGGPSHHDLWDYKPKMQAMFGQPLPEEIRDGQRITGMTSGQKTLPICPSKYKFAKHDNNDRGVRNIQVFRRGWDAHGNLPREHESQCKDVDHKRLTYRYQGRDFRLTDVHGHVIHELIA
jgi:hypothetical protein